MSLKNLFFFILALIVAGIAVRYGRSIYIPLMQNVKGKETVFSIQDKISSRVDTRLLPILKQKGFNTYPDKLIFTAFKEEGILEIYGEKEGKYILVKTYPFTAMSGILGPKLKEGDRQIPEGLYQIEYLNPNSSYYLSMKVNYPNEFDQEKGRIENRTNLGSDIFIHGKAVTIGCIPIGDEGIEEVFFMASKAFKNGIPLIISPWDFRKKTTYPEIEEVTWEKELYRLIEKELDSLPN